MNALHLGTRVGRLLVRPWLRRLGFLLLRTFRPIQRIGDKVWVTRFRDVQEVLSRPGEFSVRKFGSRMRETGGDFFLGKDDKPDERSDRERERRAALDARDALGSARAFEIARSAAAKAVDQRLAQGVLDVVEDLADVVPIRLSEEYFGLSSPGARTLLEWVQLMSWYIFNPYADRDDRTRAIVAGASFADHVHRTIAESRGGTAAPTTLLSQLLASGLGAEAVERTLLGLLAGTLGPPPRLFVGAVDRLLSLAAPRRRALHEAACSGECATLEKYLLEAGRMGPEPSLIYRACESEDVSLPREGRRGRHIEAGRTVVCWIESALRDGRAIPGPRRFDPERPAEQLMLFGHGIHECIGRELGLALLAGMAQPLFALPDLRRAPGKEGRVSAGPIGKFPAQNYPQHLLVHFDAAAARRAQERSASA